MKMYLEHANITVDDIDKAIHFFQTAFPHFKVRGQGESDLGTWKRKWLHIGTDETYIAIQDAKPDNKGFRGGVYEDIGINHLGFVVDDVEALVKRLEEAGYKESVPGEEHPYRKRAYYFDSFGNEYEFVEYLSDDPAKRNQY